MKRMIDAEKFLDKLLYMGYMDEQKSEVEEVANRMTEEAYTKDEVIAMFTDVMVDIADHIKPSNHTDSYDDGWSEGAEWGVDYIQQKINALRGTNE